MRLGPAIVAALLTAPTVVFVTCSAATGRSPGDDRSGHVQGVALESADAGIGSSRLQAPMRSRPAVARGAEAHQRQNVVGVAKKHLGAPYRWGGSSPEGFDCSGFVRYVYAQVGISLPHNAAEQYRHGAPVSRDQLKPGDLVFFDRLRHNGIYVGGRRFIHAGRSGKRVGISRLDEEWYSARWVGARRL